MTKHIELRCVHCEEEANINEVIKIGIDHNGDSIWAHDECQQEVYRKEDRVIFGTVDEFGDPYE